MDDLLSEFLTETNEGLGVLDVELVKLEQNPNDPELLSNIFRLMHTIKGTCGFLGLPRLESVAHSGENILGRVRDGELEVTAEAVSLILECLDRIREILAVLEATESEPAGDDSELISRLDACAEGRSAGSAPAASADSTEEAPAEAVATEEAETAEVSSDEEAAAAETVVAAAETEEMTDAPDTGEAEAGEPDHGELVAAEAEEVSSENVVNLAEAASPAAQPDAPAAAKPAA